MPPRVTLKTWQTPNVPVLTPLSQNTTPSGSGNVSEDDRTESDQPEEEVDELDSDEPIDNVHEGRDSVSTNAATVSKSSTKKPRAKPPTTRAPGQSLIPLSRVESILQADPANGYLSKEASFIITLATENFIRLFAKSAQARAQKESRNTVTYNDFAETTAKFDEFKFLSDMIPQTITPRNALAAYNEIRERQNALLNGFSMDSAPSHTQAQQPWSHPATTSAATISTLPKHLQSSRTNLNGSTPVPSSSASMSGEPPSAAISRDSQKSKRLRVAQGERSASFTPPPHLSGYGDSNAISAILNGNNTSYAGVKIKIRPLNYTQQQQQQSSSVQANLPTLMLAPSNNSAPKLSSSPQPITSSSNNTGANPTPPSQKSHAIIPDSLKQETVEPSNGRKRTRSQTEAAGLDGPAKKTNNGNGMTTVNGVGSGSGGVKASSAVVSDKGETPLMTRVPLPPYPTSKYRLKRSPEPSANGTTQALDTDLENRKESGVEHVNLKEEKKVSGNGGAVTGDAGASAWTQRPTSSLLEQKVNGKMDFSEALAPSAGRTIYSQRSQ